MAIYHFSVKVISRATGASALASAAYRSASRLHDQRLDRHHDFTNKAGVVHSEVMLPDGAPEHLRERESLWNAVEAAEVRKDAQLAREVEFALPRELNQAEGIRLTQDFVQREFVDQGMIADLNVHCDIGTDGQPKPHAHVMLTMREVGEDGFGAKARDWNRTSQVEQWRERWADYVNARLAELDIDARIDHRSLEAQGIELEPQHKIGAAAGRRVGHGLEAERLEEHRDIARRNGARIIAEPRVVLDAITHSQATFTTRDMAMFVHRHSDGREQFDAAMGAVRASPELVALGKDGRGEERFTSREMIETEQRLQRASLMMAERERHRLGEKERDMALASARQRGLALSGEQRAAFEHVTNARGLSVVVGYAGTGKSAMLGVAMEVWESAGYEVRGLALSGIAAENLEHGSGIASRTIASLEHQWAHGRELPGANDVLVIDEAGMVGTRQMERVLSRAHEAGAKVVLVGDPQQLQAIEAGAAFRAIHERHGGVEIGEVRRQRENWQRDAARQLATGRTGEAIRAYDEHDMVHAAETREAARGALVERWDRDRISAPDRSRIILTHTNDEVRELNALARDRMRGAGELGEDVAVRAERGQRLFANGDRVMFLRNERGLGVNNGSLGRIDSVSAARMAVMLDDGRVIAFDIKDYAHLDHGYAATIHKAQGMTVDRTHVLATPGMDSHAAYVAMSRHRDGVDLHYGREEFADRSALVRTLSRERTKDMASDYVREDPARAFGARRGMGIGERAAELVRQAPQKARGMFANFRPPAPARDQGMFAGLKLPAAGPAREVPDGGELARRVAVERHARAVADIWKMQDKELPVLPHQRAELDRARKALDTTWPHAAKDMEQAYARNPDLVPEAANGRTGQAIRAMQLEAQIRTDPMKRADRFVANWRQLRQQRDALRQAGDTRGARELSGQLAGMAKSLERDAQMESLLRPRRAELGIEMDMGRSVARDLASSAGIEMTRTRGLSR